MNHFTIRDILSYDYYVALHALHSSLKSPLGLLIGALLIDDDDNPVVDTLVGPHTRPHHPLHLALTTVPAHTHTEDNNNVTPRPGSGIYFITSYR